MSCGDRDGIYGYHPSGYNPIETGKVTRELIRLTSDIQMSVDSIIITDMNGRIVKVNEVALKMLGTTENIDLVGEDIMKIVVPEWRGNVLLFMKRLLENRLNTDFRQRDRFHN